MNARQSQRLRKRLRFVETWLVVVVIIICASAQVFFYVGSVFKAKMIEPINVLRTDLFSVVESVALTGELQRSGDLIAADTGGGAPRVRRIASARDLVEAQQNVARVEQMALEVEGFGRRKISTSKATSSVIGISDGVPTAAISVSFLREPALVELRPAYAANDGAVINWLCGKQTPPAGMIAPAVREPAVPDRFLVSSCRSPL